MYTEKKILKTYQTDRHGLIRPVMLMNELQAIADTNAEMLGAGRTFCMNNEIAWVVTHYLVDIIRLPKEAEELEFSTWPSGRGELKATRDFEIRDTSGNVIVRATSQWVMIDLKTRKPLRLSEVLPDWVSEERRALDLPFEKFPDFSPTQTCKFFIRYDDIDVNQHVNNAVYSSWATESVGFDFRDTHELRQLFINFKKEIPCQEKEICIDCLNEDDISRHKIKTGETENANVICKWKKIAYGS